MGGTHRDGLLAVSTPIPALPGRTGPGRTRALNGPVGRTPVRRALGSLARGATDGGDHLGPAVLLRAVLLRGAAGRAGPIRTLLRLRSTRTLPGGALVLRSLLVGALLAGTLLVPSLLVGALRLRSLLGRSSLSTPLPRCRAVLRTIGASTVAVLGTEVSREGCSLVLIGVGGLPPLELGLRLCGAVSRTTATSTAATVRGGALTLLPGCPASRHADGAGQCPLGRPSHRGRGHQDAPEQELELQAR